MGALQADVNIHHYRVPVHYRIKRYDVHASVHPKFTRAQTGRNSKSRFVFDRFLRKRIAPARSDESEPAGAIEWVRKSSIPSRHWRDVQTMHMERRVALHVCCDGECYPARNIEDSV